MKIKTLPTRPVAWSLALTVPLCLLAAVRMRTAAADAVREVADASEVIGLCDQIRGLRRLGTPAAGGGEPTIADQLRQAIDRCGIAADQIDSINSRRPRSGDVFSSRSARTSETETSLSMSAVTMRQVASLVDTLSAKGRSVVISDLAMTPGGMITRGAERREVWDVTLVLTNVQPTS